MNSIDKIKQQLQDYTLVLYMKGTAIFPQCGFSAKAVQLLREVLQQCNPEFAQKQVLYVNVLEDPGIREGIKQYGQWPTIPQLYVKGELIGGSDIMGDLYQSGELAKLIKGNQDV